MSKTLVDFFTSMMSGVIPKELIILIISVIPILELRGGLLAASVLHIEMYRAVLICVIGNIIPIPFILLFINKILDWMKKRKRFEKMVNKLEMRAQSKSESIKKYEFWGLLIFVGVPLPGTGAWTGALVAALLRMNMKKSFIAILGGIFMAAVIMVIIAYGIPAIVRLYT